MRSIGTKTLAALALGLLAVTPGLSAADDPGYHLTGIMASDAGVAFAVIENADGQQKLLKENSPIGDGYVKSISSGSKTVVLTFPTGEISLRLTGSGKPVEFREEFSVSDFSDEVVPKSLNPATMAKLHALAANPEKLSETQLAPQVNKLLGLSEQTRIAAYNHQSVESTRALLERLQAHISSMGVDADYLGSLAVSDPEGSRRIYLFAEE